jgi:hypothetical protein
MKKIMFILIGLLMVSCKKEIQLNTIERYKIEVVYFNGEKEILEYNLPNNPQLNGGNLWVQGEGILLCGVRKIRVLEHSVLKN